MKGDFSRFTHDPKKHYTGVLKQQGRVDLDADWNEYVEIRNYLNRTKTKDVIGPCGVPKTGGGFEIGVTLIVTNDLRGVYFVNETKGWAVATDGAILFTDDGGKTWETQASGVTVWLSGVYFVDEKKGLVVGAGGTILTTTNGGQIWNKQTSGVISHLVRVHFVDKDKGWVVGFSGTILKTTDGGANWTQQTPPSGVNKDLRGLYFVNESKGWAVGSEATILATIDGGAEWTQQAVPDGVTGHLRAVYFMDERKGWAVGFNGTILKTEDGGGNWNQQESGVTADLWAVYFVDEDKGWAVGWQGTILATENGGATWTQQSSGVSTHLWAAYFLNEKKAWAVGETGTVLTTNDGGENWSVLSPSPTNLTISDGRIYVDGILCELEAKATYLNQPDYPKPPPLEPTEGRTDLVYLDVWQRLITAVEDSDIREIALGGPDTTTRIKTIAQVKILPDVGSVSCSDDIQKWKEETAPSGGRLKTQAQVGTEPEYPCPIAEGGGYRELENRLYRVEIHEEGDLDKATFKWSRDNGSTVYEIVEFIEDGTDPPKVSKVKLKHIGRDEILKIKKDDWLEISGDRTDLNVESAGTIAKVDEVNEAEQILTLSKDVASHKDEAHPKVRRWETGPAPVTPPNTAEEPINLEDDGIEIYFSGSNFKVGDYWVFAARTSTGKIEELDHEPPHGIKHHYCKLALVTWKAEDTAEIEHCRREFPPLTEIGKGEGCCTVVVHPGEDIQAALDTLPESGGCVCLKTGTHTITEAIRIEKSNVVLHGESPGTRIERSNGVNLLTILDPTGTRITNVTVERIQFVSKIELESISDEDFPGLVLLDRCCEVTIRDCEILIKTRAPIWSLVLLGRCCEVTIRDCEMSIEIETEIPMGTMGIFVLGSNHVRIIGNRMNGTGQGILGWNSNNLDVLENSVTGPVLELGTAGFSISSDEVMGACHIERNHIKNYRLGISVDEMGERSIIAENEILRDPIENGSAEEEIYYGIDVAAPFCVIKENYLNLTASVYGGIRVTGEHALVEENSIESHIQPPSEIISVPVGIYLGPGLNLPNYGVVRCNTLTGFQNAIQVFGESEDIKTKDVRILDNSIRSFPLGRDFEVIWDTGPYLIGITLYEVSNAEVAGNHIADAEAGIYLFEGRTVHILENHIREIPSFGIYLIKIKGNRNLVARNCLSNAVGGITAINSNTITISENQTENMKNHAILVVSWLAELPVEGSQLSHNRVAWCGYAPQRPIGELGVGGICFFYTRNVNVESSEILYTGISPDGGTIYHQSTGISLRLVEGDCHIQANRIIGADNVKHSPLWLVQSGLLPVRAQVLGNTFIGVGSQTLVILGYEGDLVDKITFSNNHCEHVTEGTGQPQTATVLAAANHLTVMGNQIRADNTAYPSFKFDTTFLTAMGNITSGGWLNVPENLKPAPVEDFNHIGIS